MIARLKCFLSEHDYEYDGVLHYDQRLITCRRCGKTTYYWTDD